MQTFATMPITQRVFVHLLRRLLSLVRERSVLYSRTVVIPLDVNTVICILACSFAASSWASGSPNGCVPTWLVWQLAGVLMMHALNFTGAGMVNIFLRRLTPVIKEKALEAATLREYDAIKFQKMSRLLKVCAEAQAAPLFSSAFSPRVISSRSVLM